VTVNFSRSWRDQECKEVFEQYGWAETEEAAIAAAMAAVLKLKVAPLASACMDQGTARDRLKRLNEAKRAARPAPDTSDAKAIEYIYAWGRKYQVFKKTKTRVYYNKFEDGDWQATSPSFSTNKTCFVERAHLEMPDDQDYWIDRKGRKRYRWLYLRPQQRKQEAPVSLGELKAAMAAAHPDHGGTSAAFIEARRRYVEARRHGRRMQND
jgi:hypothetical protein